MGNSFTSPIAQGDRENRQVSGKTVERAGSEVVAALVKWS
jgi:hypothetical protein